MNRILMPNDEELATIGEEAMDFAGIGLYRYLLDGTLIFMNRQTLRVLELEEDYPDPAELSGRNVAELIDYLETPGSFRAAVLEHGSVRNREYHLRTLRGNTKWVLHNSYVVEDMATGQQAIQAIALDITEQRRTREALRRSEDKTHAILRAIPDMMFRLAADGTFREFFAVEAEDLYVDPETIVGKNIADLIPHVADRTLEVIGEALATGETQLFEYSLDMPVGERHFEARHVPLGVDETLAIIRDVTEQVAARRERKALEERMQLTQKLESLGVLAGGIAHDFNNLLTGIMGNAGLAIREIDEDHPIQARLHDIDKAAQHAAELTAELLAYSGKAAFVVEPQDLSALVGEMGHLLRTAVSKKVQLRLELPDELPLFEGDATQIRQVIMNLITNASDALGDLVGVIRIETGSFYADDAYLTHCMANVGVPSGDYVYVEVADTGCGMNSETLSHIFEPFFTTKFTGRGLGLAAVVGIVRGHGGTLRIDTHRGAGTSFRVLLPITDRPALTATEDSNDSEVLGSATVLVVDDEEAVRQAVTSILDSAGYLVLLASNGLEALELFQDAGEHIALVLLDMTMPVMDGEEPLLALRTVDPDVRVLLTSGYMEAETLGRFGDVGQVDFIQKPYQPASLMQKVARVLKGV
jgi:two-component system, cell cycle sensor histidine kinase and response regulator CckA